MHPPQSLTKKLPYSRNKPHPTSLDTQQTTIHITIVTKHLAKQYNTLHTTSPYEYHQKKHRTPPPDTLVAPCANSKQINHPSSYLHKVDANTHNTYLTPHTYHNFVDPGFPLDWHPCWPFKRTAWVVSNRAVKSDRPHATFIYIQYRFNFEWHTQRKINWLYRCQSKIVFIIIIWFYNIPMVGHSFTTYPGHHKQLILNKSVLKTKFSILNRDTNIYKFYVSKYKHFDNFS